MEGNSRNLSPILAALGNKLGKVYECIRVHTSAYECMRVYMENGLWKHFLEKKVKALQENAIGQIQGYKGLIGLRSQSRISVSGLSLQSIVSVSVLCRCLCRLI